MARVIDAAWLDTHDWMLSGEIWFWSNDARTETTP